jgi:hypothetical protein
MIPNPRISKDLIEFLNVIAPLRNPQVSTSERQVWVDVGRRQIVDQIEQLYADQEKGLLEGRSTANVLLQLSPDGSGASENRDAGHASATAARTPGAPGNRLGR